MKAKRPGVPSSSEESSENEDKLKEYLGGKEKLFGFFVGQAMKLSQGQLKIIYERISSSEMINPSSRSDNCFLL